MTDRPVPGEEPQRDDAADAVVPDEQVEPWADDVVIEIDEIDVDEVPVPDEPVEDEPVVDEPVAEAPPVPDEPVEDVEVVEEPAAPGPARSPLLEAFAAAPVADHATDEIDLSDEPGEPEPEAAVEAEPEDAAEDDERPTDVVPVADEQPTFTQSPVLAAFAAAEASREADSAGEPPSEPPVAAPRKRRFWRRKSLWALLILIGAVYVAGYFMTGSRLPQSTVVGGVDLGGMSPSAAATKLDDTLSARADTPIVLDHDDLTFEITGKKAGLALDPEASVDQAGGERSWNPRTMVGLFVGDHTYDTKLTVEESTLDAFVDSIGEAVDVEVVEPQITFPDEKPKAREPKPGLVVPREDTAELIKDAYLVDTKPLEVPTVVVEPAVDAEGLKQAITTIAEPAMSAPVTINVGDDKVALPVTAYAPALTVQVEGGALVPVIDPEKLAGPLTSSTTGIGEKAVDATVTIKAGKPVVVPGKEGVGLQPEEMAELLVPVLTETGDARSVQIKAKVVQPLFTTKDAEALKITEKISEFSTYFPYAEYRNINQSRAAALIDGVIVKPGETFSFNDTVGERTVANGFAVGTVINGGVFREELGGGVSQVVTTTYNAAFFAGMDDVEHHPHAFYIDRYPVGREATVYFGSLDLRFKNSTDYGVLIKANVVKATPGTRGETRVQMWSTKVYDIEAGASARRNFRSPGTRYDDTNRCVAQGPIQGFDIDIYRVFKQNGKTVKTETDTANYQAADTVICGKKPEPKKAAAPPPAADEEDVAPPPSD